MQGISDHSLSQPTTWVACQGLNSRNHSLPSDGVRLRVILKIRVKQTQEGKACVILYACSLTRALYLARRGRPETVYSDKIQTFVGVASWIKKVSSSERSNDFLAHQGITWKFNLSKGLWWGGQFEHQVIKELQENPLEKIF